MSTPNKDSPDEVLDVKLGLAFGITDDKGEDHTLGLIRGPKIGEIQRSTVNDSITSSVGSTATFRQGYEKIFGSNN